MRNQVLYELEKRDTSVCLGFMEELDSTRWDFIGKGVGDGDEIEGERS